MKTSAVHKRRRFAKTVYVWDIAGTLTDEHWNERRTGFSSYEAWLQDRLGKPMRRISPREYEEGHRLPYRAGWYFNLGVKPGFRRTLVWTANNETFSTGVRAQVTWRAVYLDKKYKFVFKDYFRKINSTFDYSETNIKSVEMLASYLRKQHRAGIRTVVYADDRLPNLRLFARALRRSRASCPGLSLRLYHVENRSSRISPHGWYTVVGGLRDLLKNEKSLKHNN